MEYEENKNEILRFEENKNKIAKCTDFTTTHGNLELGKIYDWCQVLIKKLDPGAIIPTNAYKGDAGMDLYCFNNFTIPARSSIVVSTKIAIEMPPGCYGRVASRSGLSIKYKIEVGAGVIDSKYRGEIKVHLYNHSDNTFHRPAGSKIAQLILTKILIPQIAEVTELHETDRGDKGFGSSD